MQAPHASPASAGCFTLHCVDPAGDAVKLSYSPHDSRLVDEAGIALLADAVEFEEPATIPARVSPEAPGSKSRAPNTLKIQLGMRCNYGCSYCNQSSGATSAVVTKSADADEFLSGLDDWLEGSPSRIEFWGGEPLLYIAKLRRLVPELRRRFPTASLSMVTNGSLLNAAILDFITEFDIYVAVSHDGPGQHLRGPDPFDDPGQAHWLREFWRRRGRHGRGSFHSVLTPANADIGATRRWLADRIGDSQLTIDTEGVVSVYDERTLDGSGRWTEEDFSVLSRGILSGFDNGEALKVGDIRVKAQDFILSLKTRRSSTALGQKCGMDDPHQLAVDLKGNVMTCQNTGAQGKHHIGHVAHMEAVQLDTATHWSFRESCNHCPVLQLCKGSCMYLDDALFAQSCENEYRYNLAILGGIIKAVTGLVLESVSGDIRRPKAQRVLKLTPV